MSSVAYQKVALVTGSSKGIGKAIALSLAKDGYFVFVTYYRDEVGGQATVSEIGKLGGKSELQKLDVADEASVIGLMSAIKSKFEHLDVLVNNAVLDVSKSIEDASFNEWKLAIDIKLHGAWLATKYSLPLLKKSENANVIVVSSSLGDRPKPDVASYSVATAAVSCLVKALALDLPRYGIRVNAIMPGEVRTANWGEQEKDDQLWQSFADQNPTKRVATVEDVADAAMLLINDPHKFLNGNFLYVNGGSHLQ